MTAIIYASVKEAPIIALLGRLTFTETFGYLLTAEELNDYLEKTFSLIKIQHSIQKAGNHFALAYWEGIPVGYFKLKLHSKTDELKADKQVQLQKIYVLKDFISKKIGAALLETALQKIVNNGFEQVWLEVLHINQRAIGFYNKFGFEEQGKHYHQIGANHFEYALMAKHIKT